MSIYYTLDGSKPSFLSSNHGWGDFTRWVEELEPLLQLDRLCNYGWNQHIPELHGELSSALADHPPADDETKTVASDLLEAVSGSAEVICITDGMVSSTDDDDDDDDGTDGLS
jgi:hypothetical protein